MKPGRGEVKFDGSLGLRDKIIRIIPHFSPDCGSTVEGEPNATKKPFLGGGLGQSPPAAGVGEDAEVDEERDEAEEGAAHAGGANRIAEADLVQGLQKKQHMSVFSWPCPAPTTRNILSLWSAPTSVAIIIYHFATFCQM